MGNRMWHQYDDMRDGKPGKPLLPAHGRGKRPTPAADIQRNTQPTGPEPEAHAIIRLDAQILRQKAALYKKRLTVWRTEEDVNCDTITLVIDDLLETASRLEAAIAGKEVKG